MLKIFRFEKKAKRIIWRNEEKVLEVFDIVWYYDTNGEELSNKYIFCVKKGKNIILQYCNINFNPKKSLKRIFRTFDLSKLNFFDFYYLKKFAMFIK